MKQALVAVLAGTQNGDGRSASCPLSSLISPKYSRPIGNIAIDGQRRRFEPKNMCIIGYNASLMHCKSTMCGFSGWFFGIFQIFCIGRKNVKFRGWKLDERDQFEAYRGAPGAAERREIHQMGWGKASTLPLCIGGVSEC